MRHASRAAPRLIVAVACAVAGAGCGGSVQRQVNGATFTLSSKEIGLANEYERGAPTGDAQAVCDYWTKRRTDADGNHLVGVFSWPPQYFENLRRWADAKKETSCAIAKEESDARAAKANEQDRLDSLAEAAREHEAREAKAWGEARPGDCAAGAKEDACDGARAYLAIVPNGPHAGEVTDALKVGAPKVATLRQLHEAEAARRATQASKLEEAAGFRVSSLRASIDDAPAGGQAAGTYLRIAFDLTATRALARGVTPIVKAACQVGDKRMVDSDPALDVHLDELAAGDTKTIEAKPYAKHPLQGSPSRCEIVVLRGVGIETNGVATHTFCYLPSEASGAAAGVRDGACDSANGTQ